MNFKNFILISLLLLSSIRANATHIIGGEIYYDYLGGNNYQISVVLYRDCATVNGAPYDNPLSLGIYSSNNVLVQTVLIPFPGSVVLPIVFTNPCVVPPTGFCNEKAVYTIIVNLPPTPGGYNVSYQRCCRRPDVINIVNPGDTGLTVTTHINGTNSNALVNSSARFTNYPPMILCNNETLIFDHSATDADGDQLLYELITPYSGATNVAPQPNPPPPPPYGLVNWGPGFSQANPFGPGATISIDPNTGILTADPLMLGLFVVGVRVKEFRNGTLINKTDRDFIFKVINCNITLQATITPQAQMTTFVSFCEGATITFENQSFGANSYKWDFGLPGITSDTSNLFQPTFTFPAPGTYTVTLVANPGWPCTDTSTQVFEVNEVMEISFTKEDPKCFKNNSFDFVGSLSGPVGTVLTWDFGPNATPTSSNQLSVNNVNFSQSGYIPVTLSAVFSSCSRTFIDSILIISQPTADFELPPGALCDGFIKDFVNTSQGATSYSWDFGVLGINTDVSTNTNPTYSYITPGTYEVSLIASNNTVCNDTVKKMISVIESILVSFTHNDSLCITGNSFDFIGTATGPSGYVINWNFGPNASISTSDQLIVNGVSYSTPGVHTVTLNISTDECEETATSTIYIFSEPTINFQIDDKLKCAPYFGQFVNLSTSETPAQYLWDFGDGTSSTVKNPSHVYPNAGIYDVQLTLTTTEGCVRNLILNRPDLINVHPSPISKFSVDPLITNICDSKITFTDRSSGALSYFYMMDDQGGYSLESNPVYVYQSSGQKRPMQVVTNEFGCQDSSYKQLYIEPFTVYIPNTFTPDGNQFNNVFEPVIYLPIISWEFKIFNRWGETLFISQDPEFGWDGTYDGKLVKDDTYTYVLKYTSCESSAKVKVLNGHVNLLK
jgi:gliding motility-associated-like protein